MTISFKWNGRDGNGRAVGTGTCLAIVKLHDLLRNRVERETMKIGVVK